MGAGDFARELKQKPELKRNNIDYAKVIATRVYDRSFKNTCREFIRMCIFDYEFCLKESQGTDLLCVYSYRGKKRPDFDGIFDQFCSYVDGRCDVLELIYKFDYKFTGIKLLYFVKWFLSLIGKKVKNPLYVSILLAQFFRYDRKLDEVCNLKKYDAVITFCDAHGIENMIAQKAKITGVATATLQHGQYRVLKKETENADVEAYENFVSDYLLAWGRRTQDEFEKAGIARERIIPVGALKPFSANEKLDVKKTHSVFGVVLDGNIYEESNRRMIEYANKLAKKYNLKYVLRMHPKNKAETYIPLCESKYLKKVISRIENKEYANMVDFSLVHMTGVFVELLSVNSPMFMMEDKYLEDIFKIPNATFSNLEECFSTYELFEEKRQEFIEVQYEIYREFNEEGILKNNYLMALEAMLRGKVS